MPNKIMVTWIKSGIGYPVDQKRTLRALGFTKLNQTVEHDDNPTIRGMIKKIKHLLKVEPQRSDSSGTLE